MPASPQPPNQPSMRSATSGSSRLKARAVPASTFNSAAFAATSPPRSSPQVAMQPSRPSSSTAFPTMQPTSVTSTSQRATFTSGPVAPNYNISLSPQPPTVQATSTPSYSFSQPIPQPVRQTPAMQASMQPAQPLQPTVKPPPGWSSGLMQPTKATQPAMGSFGSAGGWDDFDPLK